MDSLADFDQAVVVADTNSNADAGQAKLIDPVAARTAELQARFKRRIANQTRRAHALGMMEGIISQLRPGDIAVDCGANVGLVTRRLADTGATVYAFEPDPVAFKQLEDRLGDRPNVCLIPAAVAAEEGTATLHRSVAFERDPVAGTVGSTIIEGARRAEAGDEDHEIEVPVLNLPTIIEDLLAGRDPTGLPPQVGLFRRPGNLAFLKLDIEGAELDLLHALHASGTLSKVRCTVVETHERKFPALRRRFARLRKAMAKHYKPSQVYLDWV